VVVWGRERVCVKGTVVSIIFNSNLGRTKIVWIVVQGRRPVMIVGPWDTFELVALFPHLFAISSSSICWV